jgi:PAT family beta-lactamase induction signal transducer AmpG
VLTILGALTGGWFVNRYGIFHGLLWLGITQVVSNLGYVAVASLDLPRESIYVASIVESYTQGLGTAAYLSFLMNLCDKEHAATQYAILTALMAVTRDIGGAFTGIGVEALGYSIYFAVTTALALPGLALLPFIRGRIREAGDELDGPDSDQPSGHDTS